MKGTRYRGGSVGGQAQAQKTKFEEEPHRDTVVAPEEKSQGEKGKENANRQLRFYIISTATTTLARARHFRESDFRLSER